MDKSELRERIESGFLLLDGATGTQLQDRGLPAGACPELWVLQNPDVLLDLQRAYFQSGSHAVCTCTFGANEVKLAEYDVEPADVPGLNERLARLSRRAAGEQGLVAGELGPTGQFVDPFGPLGFERAVEVFRAQVSGLVAGGADLLIIQTMMDIQEARAALIAARQACDLPVLASLTFNDDGRTLTGTPPEAGAIILQSLGAAAVGCNCSTGPAGLVAPLEHMRSVARVPLLAKPNAGMPTMRDGRATFSLGPDEFARRMEPLLRIGAGVVGGCCGTGPEHMAALAQLARGMEHDPPEPAQRLVLAGPHGTVAPGPDRPVAIIGERINPTGKKKLQAALREGNLRPVRRLAAEQVRDGAELLDVNVGMAGIDETQVMLQIVRTLSPSVDAPLALDSSDPDVLSAALRLYPGRALVNSISAERKKLERLLPVAADYGAAVIILPLDDEEVPPGWERRAELVEQIFAECRACGLRKCDVVVDGLVMAISSDHTAARQTLRTVRWAAEEFGVNAMMGTSNVSFGLPGRRWLNSTVLSMGVASGMTMAIANPGAKGLMETKLAADALAGLDDHCTRYVARMGPGGGPEELAEAAGPAEAAARAVLEGESDTIASLVHEALEADIAPLTLVNEHLVPAIMTVGDRFQSGEYFLPQLMMSAETMVAAFEILEPMLAAEGSGASAGTVVLATVEGDIHDIGKNIVALMLRNHGFRVIDLGKDVPADTIVQTARREQAAVVGLSALMTTTMTEMENVIERLHADGIGARVMVGGAVITQDYAEEIGADAFADNAVAAVRAAQKLVGSPEPP
jgi:5-methyltetrahydrofolate--homocysteine methyltransferase